MPADDVGSRHHAFEGLPVELGDIIKALRAGAESFHSPLLLLGRGKAEAAVTVEDRLPGAGVNLVGELHIVRPEAIGLDGDDIDVFLQRGQDPWVMPHRHVLVAEEEMVGVVLVDDFPVNAIPLVGDEMEEGDHVSLGLFLVRRLRPINASGHGAPGDSVGGTDLDAPDFSGRLGTRMAFLEKFKPAEFAGRSFAQSDDRVDPGIDQSVDALGFLISPPHDPAGNIGVEITEEIATVLVLAADIADAFVDEVAKVLRENVGPRPFAVSFAPTSEWCRVEARHVVDLILVERGIDGAMGVRPEGVEMKLLAGLDLSIDPPFRGLALGVESSVRIHHVGAISLERGLLVVRREPKVRLDMIDARADEPFAVGIDEPPDAINLFDPDEARGLAGAFCGGGALNGE